MRSSACGLLIGLALCLTLSASIPGADDPPRTETAPAALPRIVLVGDSIRLGYAPIVARRLEGRAVVISPKANGGDSANVLKHLDEWVIREQPAVVHFNCGIHDTKKSKTSGRFQVPPEAYEANLRTIVERIRAGTKATVVFATTTPVLDDRAARARTKAAYELLDASTEQYNGIARKVMGELGVPVDDLRAAVGDADTRARLMGSDGIHFQAEGREVLGNAVATFLTTLLPAAQAAHGPGSGPVARRETETNEVRYDLVVVGGTPGDVACAVRAARQGLRVLLVEPSAHLGGILANGLGVSNTLYEGKRAPVYDELRQAIFDHYRTTYGEQSAAIFPVSVCYAYPPPYSGYKTGSSDSSARRTLMKRAYWFHLELHSRAARGERSMSTGLLQHAFSISGYEYVRTDYQSGAVIFAVQQEPKTLRWVRCGSRDVQPRGRVERRFRSLLTGPRQSTPALTRRARRNSSSYVSVAHRGTQARPREVEGASIASSVTTTEPPRRPDRGPEQRRVDGSRKPHDAGVGQRELQFPVGHGIDD
jgi:lysophospholipase L1-like esterase